MTAVIAFSGQLKTSAGLLYKTC